MTTHGAAGYRPEIDGLRAIAVLAVVLYHFGLPGVGGGFVGVDVFFVISGFLIGGLLWDERTRTGRIGLGAFFLRRLRRLAPAFFAMVAVTTAVAAWVLLPFEFREYGKSLIAATLWLSNVQFFREAGYFDIGAENKVLLHTWSLAVEEQFYIALPLLLLALRRAGTRTVVGVLVAAWAASLAASLAMQPHSPTASFFLFPLRAWEMLSGVLLAVWARQAGDSGAHGALWSWLGLALVLGAIGAVRPGEHFPGWQALVPVAGTVLLLLNGRDDNAVNRLLAARLPVFVGLISYSLYLWHWPVFTLSTYWHGGPYGAWPTAGWLALAVALSVAAWALVERPARRHLPDRALLPGFVVLAALAVAAGAWAWRSDGAPDRFGPPARTHIDASTSFYYDQRRCQTPADGPFKGIDVCAVGPEGAPRVLFWGDSHLRAIMGAVDHAATEAGTPALVVWRGGCPPLFGLAKKESASTPAQDARCLADTRQMQDGLGGLPSLRQVVLVGRWAYYASGAGTGVDAHNTIALSAAPGGPLATGPATPQALYDAAWDHTVQLLRPHFDRVHVLRQVPEMPRYLARDVARALAHGRQTPAQLADRLAVTDAELRQRNAASEAAPMRLAQAGLVEWIDPQPRLCRPRCEVVQDGVSYYFDNNHLNERGAEALRGLWLPLLKDGAAK